MTKFCFFASSHVLNTIHFAIVSIVTLPIKNVTSLLFSNLCLFEINVVIKSITLTFLTCNTTLYMYSCMTLSCYMCLYYVLLSAALTRRPRHSLLLSLHCQVTSYLPQTCGQLSCTVPCSHRSTYWTLILTVPQS